jgi:hypothetical protein
MMGCTQSDEFYTESGSYFGCKTIDVGCTTAAAPSSSVLGMYYGWYDYPFMNQTQRVLL